MHKHYGYKYAWLRFQYYDLILHMSEGILTHYLETCKHIFKSFPEHENELTMKSAQAVETVIKKIEATH
jgi:hypothetical protein